MLSIIDNNRKFSNWSIEYINVIDYDHQLQLKNRTIIVAFLLYRVIM